MVEEESGAIIHDAKPIAPDRYFLKPEAIFLKKKEGALREYCVFQFSDAAGQRYEAQFLLPLGNYHETLAKNLRRLSGVNPFLKVKDEQAEGQQEQKALFEKVGGMADPSFVGRGTTA